MKIVTIALALTLTTAPLVAAKGRGGHGGGRSSGGHASGGRAASGGHAATGHATARSAGGGATTRSAGGSSTAARAAGESSGSATARGRDGRPSAGTAVPRTTSTTGFIPARPAAVTPLFVLPYLVRPNFLGFGFGGLGSFYIPYGSWYDDPFYSYYLPYSLNPYYSYPYADGAVAPGGGAAAYAPLPFAIDDDEMGKLRLQVDQRLAQVYVDGYYAGIVDEFDGHFQHLDLTPGPHHIQIDQAGYAPLSFDVNIVARHTTDYRARMAPAQPAY